MFQLNQPPALQSDLLRGHNNFHRPGTAEWNAARKVLDCETKVVDFGKVYGEISDGKLITAVPLEKNSKVVTVDTPQGRSIVNVTSDIFKLIPITEIVGPIEELLGKNFDYFARYRHSDYCRFFIDYVIASPQEVKDGDGDIILPKIRLQYGYAGDVRYDFWFGFYRQICTNGMTVLKSVDAHLKSKSTRKRLPEVALHESLDVLVRFVENAEEFKKQYILLGDRAVENLEDRIKEVAAATKFPKGLVTAAVERAELEVKMYGYDPSDWTVYNGLNYILNHEWEALKMQEWNRQLLDVNILTHLLES